jgi:hypothetical protein
MQLRIEKQTAVAVAYARRGNHVNAVARMIEQRSSSTLYGAAIT